LFSKIWLAFVAAVAGLLAGCFRGLDF